MEYVNRFAPSHAKRQGQGKVRKWFKASSISENKKDAGSETVPCVRRCARLSGIRSIRTADEVLKVERGRKIVRIIMASRLEL